MLAVLKTFKLLNGVKRLEIIGGEPLDYPYIDKIIIAGNESSIERLVLITTGINEKTQGSYESGRSVKVGILLHSGYAPLKAANLLDDKDLAGSALQVYCRMESLLPK